MCPSVCVRAWRLFCQAEPVCVRLSLAARWSTAAELLLVTLTAACGQRAVSI